MGFFHDVISIGGSIPGYFDQAHSFGLMIERFKCHWRHFIHGFLSSVSEDNRDKHRACFGLSTLSTFKMFS